MKRKHRIAAAALAAALLTGAAGCSNADQSWCAQRGDETLPVGVYVVNLYTSISTAQNQEGVDSSVSLLEQQIDGQPAEQWIQNRALLGIKEYFYLKDQLDALGAPLTDGEQTEAESLANSMWTIVPDSVKKYVAQDSFTIAYGETSRMLSKLFDLTYGAGGSQEVSQEDLQEYFEGDYYDFDYLFSSLAYKATTEISGDEEQQMTDEESAERKALFEDYASQIQAGAMTMEDAAEDFGTLISAAEDQLYHRTLDSAAVEASFPEAIKTNLDEMADGEVRCFEVSGLSDGVVVLRKNSIADAAEEYLADEANRNTLLTAMKSDEFTASVEAAADAYSGVTFNDEAIRQYSASQFYTFTPSSSSAAG